MNIYSNELKKNIRIDKNDFTAFENSCMIFHRLINYWISIVTINEFKKKIKCQTLILHHSKNYIAFIVHWIVYIRNSLFRFYLISKIHTCNSHFWKCIIGNNHETDISIQKTIYTKWKVGFQVGMKSVAF